MLHMYDSVITGTLNDPDKESSEEESSDDSDVPLRTRA